MKTYYFIVKNCNFSIESESSLRDVAYSSQFLRALENLDFFDNADNSITLYSSDWDCLQENVKGVFTEETFDIQFEAEKTWSVS